jgi:hypothetical protein
MAAGAFASGVAAAVMLAGCAHRVAQPGPPDPVFLDATPRLGETVSVRGTLAWAFPDRDLYPPGATARRRDPAHCLPVLIPVGDATLAAIATRLNGSLVQVDGVIVQAAPPGPATLSTCKAAGIRVEALAPAR